VIWLKITEDAMQEVEKITIIEGPPPTFELVSDAWLLSMTEGPLPTRAAMCKVRAFNGPSLVERCHRAWREGLPIRLEYRSEDGLTQEVPIIAARWFEQDEGDVLQLWVSYHEDDVEIEIDIDFEDYDDGFDDDIDDDIDDVGFNLSI
jgi:hypothetical protein